MTATIGATESHLFTTPRPGLLREVSGIEPGAGGLSVFLEEHGVRSTQRLSLADVGGGVVVGLWPAELKPQAQYLYADGRAGALIAAARKRRWSVEANPHLAFHTAPGERRLYLNPEVDAGDYARRWEAEDGGWIGQYTADEVRATLWPWLKERRYAEDADDELLEAFLPLLGRRAAHLRAGLKLLRRWDPEAVRDLGGRSVLAPVIRSDVDRILGAAGEPPLPASRP